MKGQKKKRVGIHIKASIRPPRLAQSCSSTFCVLFRGTAPASSLQNMRLQRTLLQVMIHRMETSCVQKRGFSARHFHQQETCIDRDPIPRGRLPTLFFFPCVFHSFPPLLRDLTALSGPREPDQRRGTTRLGPSLHLCRLCLDVSMRSACDPAALSVPGRSRPPNRGRPPSSSKHQAGRQQWHCRK